MSQMTIRQIPDAVERRLRSMAKRNHTSLNKAAVAALSAGVGVDATTHRKRDLSGFVGTWSDEQAREFNERLKVFEHTDDEVWK